MTKSMSTGAPCRSEVRLRTETRRSRELRQPPADFAHLVPLRDSCRRKRPPGRRPASRATARPSENVRPSMSSSRTYTSPLFTPPEPRLPTVVSTCSTPVNLRAAPSSTARIVSSIAPMLAPSRAVMRTSNSDFVDVRGDVVLLDQRRAARWRRSPRSPAGRRPSGTASTSRRHHMYATSIQTIEAAAATRARCRRLASAAAAAACTSSA